MAKATNVNGNDFSKSKLFQQCEKDTDCTLSNETCQTPIFGNGTCTIPEACFCLTADFEFVFCSTDTDCDGKICAKESTKSAFGVCLTCLEYTDLPENSQNALDVDGKCNDTDMNHSNSSTSSVCIDIDHLTHFERSQLIFSNHFRASVLCDSHGSCATPGHMVVYHGKTMMMQTYCKDVDCIRRIRSVNSPRMKVGLRIPSRSVGLEFTPLSASRGSYLEERVLSLLLRVGL